MKVEVLTALIVVPDGTPVPVTLTPTTSPLRLLRFVTTGDPLVRVPVKVTEPRLYRAASEKLSSL